jgi:hypothetical protein
MANSYLEIHETLNSAKPERLLLLLILSQTQRNRTLTKIVFAP